MHRKQLPQFKYKILAPKRTVRLTIKGK